MPPRRSKRNVASSSHSNLYFDRDAERIGEHISTASILGGRKVVFTGMPQYIVNIFLLFGWIHYLEIEVPFYSECVRQFFANFRAYEDDEGNYYSMVCGVHIPNINAVFLDDLVNAPHSGEHINLDGNPHLLEGIDLSDFLRDICKPNKNVGALKSSKLTDIWQIIHHICISNLVPKGGDKYSIYKREKTMLSYLYSRVPVNLGHLILDQMRDISQEISRSANRSLPFGHVITLILNAHNIVPIGDPNFPSSTISWDSLINIHKTPTISRSQTQREPSTTIPQESHTETRGLVRTAFHNIRRLLRNGMKSIRNEARSRDRNHFSYLQSSDPNNPILRSMSSRGTFGVEEHSWLDEPLSDSEASHEIPSHEPSHHSSLQSRRHTLRPHTRSARHSTSSLPTSSSSIPEAVSSSHRGGGNDDDDDSD